ncbi:hypothetical protein PYR66_00415 [Klebsiella aerogenes]|nr:hypothetical protein PYR66_00415 [Klebsiella aerogenes]
MRHVALLSVTQAGDPGSRLTPYPGYSSQPAMRHVALLSVAQQGIPGRG